MKLRIFDATLKGTKDHAYPPTITFGKTTYLGTSTVRLFNLQEGDTILLSQDQDNPKEWYIAKGHPGQGFHITPKNQGKGTSVSCRAAASEFKKCFPGVSPLKFRIARTPIQGDDGISWHAILTAPAVKQLREMELNKLRTTAIG